VARGGQVGRFSLAEGASLLSCCVWTLVAEFSICFISKVVWFGMGASKCHYLCRPSSLGGCAFLLWTNRASLTTSWASSCGCVEVL